MRALSPSPSSSLPLSPCRSASSARHLQFYPKYNNKNKTKTASKAIKCKTKVKERARGVVKTRGALAENRYGVHMNK